MRSLYTADGLLYRAPVRLLSMTATVALVIQGISSGVPAREPVRREVGNLVLDGIPELPSSLQERIRQYQNTRAARFLDWAPSLAHFSDRLRCGVDVVGISHFVTFLENTEAYRRDLRRAEYGDERDPEMRAFLNAISPTTNVSRIQRPLFVAHGRNDPRVPVGEAEQIVKAVRASGLSVWYLLALDEGHGFQKKANRDAFTSAASLFLQECFSGSL